MGKYRPIDYLSASEIIFFKVAKRAVLAAKTMEEIKEAEFCLKEIINLAKERKKNELKNI